MRLFLLAVLLLGLSGCRREEEPAAGALRVKVFYATFHPACMKLTATDRADASRSVTTDVTVREDRRSDERTVAVFRREGWSRELTLTVEAHERNCDGPVVASQTQDAEVPESGLAYVTLDMRAEDLDGDGFVSTAQNGTDCDDGKAEVHPGATETCDGVDTNCAAGELDVEGSVTRYADVDGDGYGDPGVRVSGCSSPVGSVSNASDCDDSDAEVHPDQQELRCDGKDENCDNVPDDAWTLNDTCTTTDGCTGVVACRPGDTSGTACRATQSPDAWFVDLDGDGKAGSEVRACMQPQGSVTTRADCDESSRFAFEGRAETCDWIDNDCEGGVDEGLDCASIAWTTGQGVAGGTELRAAAAYAVNAGWAAGPGGKLVHAEGSTLTEHTGCAGDWHAAWARPSDGRVFLGSADGKLATTSVRGGACEVVKTPATGRITGMVGFEGNGATTVYAVASDGSILRWAWAPSPASAPQQVARVAANLRDIHGTSPDTLVAVGAQDYQVNEQLPRIFRVTPGSGEWTQEALPREVPAGGFLRAVHVLTPQLAYAVGDDGRMLEREGTTWRLLASPPATGTVPDLNGVVGFGRTAVYAVSSLGEVHRYDGAARTWTLAAKAPSALFAIDGVDPRGIWAVGHNGSFARWLP